MDQRAHDVEEDLKNILHTRLALTQKIQLLEKRVEDTVQGTKAAALATLDFARNKAVDFVESATYHMNPSVQANRRPWIMVGGAIAVGFVAGLIEQRRRASGVYPYYPPKAAGADVMPSQAREAEVPRGVYPFYSAQDQVSIQRPFRVGYERWNIFLAPLDGFRMCGDHCFHCGMSWRTNSHRSVRSCKERRCMWATHSSAMWLASPDRSYSTN